MNKIALWSLVFCFCASVAGAQDRVESSRAPGTGIVTPLLVRDLGTNFAPSRVNEIPDGWSETDNQTNSLATATHTAVAGDDFYITHVVAQCETGTETAKTVRLLDGAGVLWLMNTTVANEVVRLDLAVPYRATTGNAVSADISACGTGFVGRVTLLGYTLTAP